MAYLVILTTYCKLEVERAMAQLYFWLKLGELSQLGSAQLIILDLLASSAQLSSPFWGFCLAQLSSAHQFESDQLSSFHEPQNEPKESAHLAHQHYINTIKKISLYWYLLNQLPINDQTDLFFTCYWITYLGRLKGFGNSISRFLLQIQL